MNATKEVNLVRDVKLQVETAPDSWTDVRQIQKFSPKKRTKSTEDAATMDDAGWAFPVHVGQEWSAEIDLLRAKTTLDELSPADTDPGQDHLLAAAEANGLAGSVKVRWFRRDGSGTGRQGTAIVQAEPANDSPTGLDVQKITLTGQGPLETIANPLEVAS